MFANVISIFKENKSKMAAAIQDLENTVARIKQGGDKKARKRHTSKGKMLPILETISCLLDPGYVLFSPFKPCSSLVEMY
ncbi:hypothetical protein ACROYT_G028598 [Oculina patagonica]